MSDYNEKYKQYIASWCSKYMINAHRVLIFL